MLRACWLSISLLASFGRAAEKSQADYFVHSLPGQPKGPLLKMHAGFVLSSARETFRSLTFDALAI
jgi:hypothetical protein